MSLRIQGSVMRSPKQCDVIRSVVRWCGVDVIRWGAARVSVERGATLVDTLRPWWLTRRVERLFDDPQCLCPQCIHWSITGRFTEPVTTTIVLMCLLAISASNTICMHCIHIVLLAEIASKHINTIVWVTGSVNLPVMLQCSQVSRLGWGDARD